MDPAAATSSVQFDFVLSRLMSEEPKIVHASKNLLAQESASRPDYSPMDILTRIQTVLKTLKTLSLQDPVQYGNTHPQLDSQSGLQRMDELIEYKAVFSLVKRAQLAKQSPAQLLGKTSFKILLPQLTAAVLEKSNNDDLLHLVLNAFASSVSNTGIEEDDLIWASDMSAVLSRRHSVRKEQARIRQEKDVVKQIVHDEDDFEENT